MHAFVQDRLRRMLENRDAGDRLVAIASAVPIREQQNANGERDEDHAERKPFNDVDHNVPEWCAARGCEGSEDSREARGSKEWGEVDGRLSAKAMEKVQGPIGIGSAK